MIWGIIGSGLQVRRNRAELGHRIGDSALQRQLPSLMIKRLVLVKMGIYLSIYLLDGCAFFILVQFQRLAALNRSMDVSITAWHP